MSIERERQTWEKLGLEDPLWAILSWDDKKGERWNIDEFFATGQKTVGDTIEHMARFGLENTRDKRVLDFGCGVGRNTRSFSKYFRESVGVDISQPMVDQARRLNQDIAELCTFIANPQENLSVFEDCSFDFVFSLMVLQHNRPHLIRNYIQEFMRVLKPGGFLYFQLPAQTKPSLKGQILRWAPEFLLQGARMVKHRSRNVFGMYWLESTEVESLIRSKGGTILESHLNPEAQGNYIDAFHTVQKLH